MPELDQFKIFVSHRLLHFSTETFLNNVHVG